MNVDQLQNESRKDLSDRAKLLGIAGHNTMRKEDLVKAITRAMKKKEKEKEKAKAKAAKAMPALNGKHAANGKPAAPAAAPVGVARKKTDAKKAEAAPAAAPRPPKSLQGGHAKDRIVVVVRDPYWLHAYWELTHQSVQRAEAALAQDWHGARPILRVCDVSSQDTTSTAEGVVRDIEIHGGCNNWYIEVPQPPKSYRVDVGYMSKRGQFYVLARSNVVSNPKAGMSDTLDENWSDVDAKQADRLYAMSSGFDPSAGDTAALKEFFEERLRRPMSAPPLAPTSNAPRPKDGKFFFNIEAEMIVFGRTIPGTRVTVQGEPVKLRPDGTFTMRYSFPDGRQILPAIAEGIDGEERKVVLSVERNTRSLEPAINDTEG